MLIILSQIKENCKCFRAQCQSLKRFWFWFWRYL